MNQTTTPREIVEPDAAKPEQKEDWKSFSLFLLKLAIIVLVFRSFVFTSFNIPSESMMPRLLVGDYLFAAKWPYGYGRSSMPFDIGFGDGRIFASQPERGDVAIFKHPVDRSDYIKRVIGLPGDRVQMKAGLLHINGEPVKRGRVEDFVLPVSPEVIEHAREVGRASPCFIPTFETVREDGSAACEYPQYRETLPNGVSYNTLDMGMLPQDDTETYLVPEGHLFMMGDNRDNSLDSRFPALAGQGIGFVPQNNLVAEASFMYFSTDGSASWIKPWTWFTAARWSRIGRGI